MNGRFGTRIRLLLPGLIALLTIVGVVTVGIRSDWRLPKYSTLFGPTQIQNDDWCSAHGVPASGCVECAADRFPRGQEFGWCKTHGIAECPLCHPELAQLTEAYTVSPEDLNRAERALAFAPRTINNSKCQSHRRRIQLVSAEIVDRLGIQIAPVREGHVTESVSANGEVSFDPTRVARVATRSSGILFRVARQVGDKVKKGDLLALVDSAEVGKSKTQFQQCLFELALKRQTLDRVRDISGAVIAPNRVYQAEADVADAQVRVLAGRQSLVNLGLPAHIPAIKGLEAADVTAQLQFLGIEPEIANQLETVTSSSNLLPILAPLDGEILSRNAMPGESVDSSDVLFVIADTSRVWLKLNIRLEDADRVQVGQSVRFLHQGHDDWDEGRIVWVSPAADERTRTVPVRAELANLEGLHHAQTFGTARIELRDEPRALVVPSSAVHWDGDCHVVFVRDRHFDELDAHKVFHVRKVRPGARDILDDEPVTEIAVGVLPGELLASTNSGILRSELLKNHLGAG